VSGRSACFERGDVTPEALELSVGIQKLHCGRRYIGGQEDCKGMRATAS